MGAGHENRVLVDVVIDVSGQLQPCEINADEYISEKHCIRKRLGRSSIRRKDLYDSKVEETRFPAGPGFGICTNAVMSADPLLLFSLLQKGLSSQTKAA